ncbi:MAG: DNA polymerase III subunit delta' [candidate division FCPU426 bacterium]
MSALDLVQGQEYAKRVLSSALAAGRCASSYLFYGPPGCGKKTAANALAQALFCRQDPGRGCGDCASCRRVQGNKHPDYFVFKPSGLSFKVEQVRELLKEASLRPYEAPRRLFVLDKAELLTGGAGNALLKVLEEPVEGLVFVLVSTNRSRLLPTIASRCQALRFGPLPQPVLAGLLASTKGMPAPEAEALASLSAGSMRLAEKLSGEDGQELRALAEDFLEAASTGSAVAQLDWAHSAALEKRRLDTLLDLIAAYLREHWVEKSGLPRHLKMLAAAPAHGGGLSPEKLRQLMLKLAEAQGQLKRNANLSLVLENLALN